MQDWSDRRKEIKRKKKEERMEGIRGHPRKEKRVTFTSLLPNPSKKKAVHFLKRAKGFFPYKIHLFSSRKVIRRKN